MRADANNGRRSIWKDRGSRFPVRLDRLLPDLTHLVSFAESALPITQIGPGNGAQAELRLFLNTLFDVAIALADPTKLLGHDEFAKVDPKDEVAPVDRVPPAFFRFVQEVLHLANIYGGPGISKTALPDETKAAAIEKLRSYTKKKKKTLSKQLDRIRTDIRAVQDSGSPQTTTT
jgi:hypothetical protein